MSYGQQRNTGIAHITRYEQALDLLENTKPIKGSGANGGKIPLGYRHRVAEFYLELNEDKSIDCMCYRTAVVSFKPDGNILIKNGGWASITTCMFIEEVLGVSSRIKDGTINVSFNGGEYRVDNELCLTRVDGRLTAMNQAPSHVHRVNRKQANIVRKDYTEFTKYLVGMLKLREAGMVLDAEFINVFGAFENHPNQCDMPSDVSLRVEASVNAMIDMMQSKDPQTMYRASLQIIKQFGQRHYWRDMGFSLQPHLAKNAVDTIIFAKHKAEVFDVEEVPVGTIKKDLWKHLF